VAVAAANAGISVVLAEKGDLGGANIAGTIPSKALIAAANRYEALRSGPAMGVSGAPLQVNLARVQEHVRSAVDAVAANNSAERLTALGVKVIRAPARFVDQRTLVAGDATIRARRFVIATGAKSAAPRYPGLEDIECLTFGNVFDTTRKMGHLIVLGATRYGLELAQAYTRLGIDATVIDDRPALADQDPELVALVLERLHAEGIRIRDRTPIVSVARRRGGVRVTVSGRAEGEEIPVDGSHLLLATGSAPEVDGLGLDRAGIEFDDAGIKVDRQLKTSNARIYAIGDVVAGPHSVSRAEYHATLVVKSALEHGLVRNDPEVSPALVLTDPPLASVGLREFEAEQKHRSIKVLRLPFSESDLAQTERATAGLIKVVATDRGQIVGAAAVGREAGEIIALWSLAIANQLDIAAMQTFVAPYPSRADISRRVAATFAGPGLTPLPKRRIIDILRKFGG
ncbi:MAG: FAD-dependent oxidoreductase, partial [Bauldia sp.]|nr:FAD-dependent oxidoreductase [Bauldia sp.]